MKKIELNSKLSGLLGFAQKSRAIESGFEAVRRGIVKGKIAFVLVDESLAQNSFKKISLIAKRHHTPMMIVKSTRYGGLVNMAGYKIVGMHQGQLAKGFIDKLKQENQCL